MPLIVPGGGLINNNWQTASRWHRNNPVAQGPPSYAGPGDLGLPAAAGWWGLRAYSNATAGTNCCIIKRASDSTSSTFNTLAGGALDTASIATFLTATTGVVTQLFDQSGGGHNMTLLTSTLAYTANAITTRSAMAKTSTSSTDGLASTLSQNAGAAMSVSTVMKMGTTAAASALVDSDSGGFYFQRNFTFHWTAVQSQFGIYGNSATALTSGNWYASGVDSNGNGSTIHFYTNGSADGTAAQTSNTGAAHWFIGNAGADTADNGNDLIGEVGVWNSVLTAGNFASLSSNQRTFWGF